MKPEECKDCSLYSCEGIVPSELNGQAGWNLEGSCDVLFVSEAPGRHEVLNKRPFANPKGAGGILRQTLAQLGIEQFGIANVFRCRPPNNKLPEGAVPGTYCKRLWSEELQRWKPKIVVPLGGVGLSMLAPESGSITSVRGRLFSVNGTNILPMLHPAYLLRKRIWWRDWELDVEKLGRFLKGKRDYISLEDQTVTKADTFEMATKMLRELGKYELLSCDIETASFNMPWQNGELLTIAFAWSSSEAYSFPVRFTHGENFAIMKELLESPHIAWLWYNGIYDVQHIWALGIQARIDRDAMLEMHLHDERLNVHKLKKDAGIYLDAPNWEESLEKHKIPNDTSHEAQQAWRDMDEDELTLYNGYDTTHTMHLSEVVRDRMGVELTNYCDTLLVPAYNMLARARRVGIRVDVFKIHELQGKFVPVLQELEQKLIDISGDRFFNPRSPQQKLALLHRHKIMVPNTRRETLQVYEGDETIDAMLAYSEAHKMQSTYIEGIVDDISDDMRVHPDWRLPAETGRCRSSDPNILGVPRKAEESEHRWKRLIKEIYVADKGMLLAHLDRKQSEVRVACFLSEDESLGEILRSGEDIHSGMARRMYGENFTYEQRVLAKMVVFGIIYNREAPSLARQFTAVERARARSRGEATWHVWSVQSAQAVINAFWANAPQLYEWKKAIMHEALTAGELTSFLGRVRRFGLITWENRKDVENEAVNFPISSVSSDLNLISCMETMKHFGKYGVEVLAPIHDAGLLLVPNENIVKDITALWESIPLKVLGTGLPFPVDASVGERWSDL